MHPAWRYSTSMVFTCVALATNIGTTTTQTSMQMSHRLMGMRRARMMSSTDLELWMPTSGWHLTTHD